MTKNQLSKLINTKKATIGIIGLGYVGLPLAILFATAWYISASSTGRIVIVLCIPLGLGLKNFGGLEGLKVFFNNFVDNRLIFSSKFEPKALIPRRSFAPLWTDLIYLSQASKRQSLEKKSFIYF